MEYSPEVRRRFQTPAWAGAFAAGVAGVVAGVAEDRSLGFWVRIQVRSERGTIQQVRFQAFGCPHSIAAADLVASELEGSPVERLSKIDIEQTAAVLDLPREKFGKLLRIEDALAACAAEIDAAQVN